MSTESLDEFLSDDCDDEVILLENGIDPKNRKENELATPEDLFYEIVKDVHKRTGVALPDFDVFASDNNAKCIYWITKEQDAFSIDWLFPNGKSPSCWWINHPHDKHMETLFRLHNQFKSHRIPAIMIIPGRTRRTHYWDVFVEEFRIGGHPMYDKSEKFIYNWPIHKSSIKFEKDGKPILNKKGKESHAGNSYEVMVFDPRLVNDWKYELHLDKLKRRT